MFKKSVSLLTGFKHNKDLLVMTVEDVKFNQFRKTEKNRENFTFQGHSNTQISSLLYFNKLSFFVQHVLEMICRQTPTRCGFSDGNLLNYYFVSVVVWQIFLFVHSTFGKNDCKYKFDWVNTATTRIDQ